MSGLSFSALLGRAQAYTDAFRRIAMSPRAFLVVSVYTSMWLSFPLATLPSIMARRNARSDPPPTEGGQGVLDIRRPPKVVQCVLDLPSYFLSYFLPNFPYIQPASYISYILGLLPPSLFLSPGGRAFRKADPK